MKGEEREEGEGGKKEREEGRGRMKERRGEGEEREDE